ncbi:1-(5-phosphoribosyl)-5-[(5-phosphoribosylamino)methylideneamino] imidazole-4-carboxamide isomerase [Alkalibacterium subtropicum]|uniref:1-(5-phosphoribosyl)-5-[(5-phosphoribosylamino)methylideneamino] imidazole-4-carboxamide isomerase n=1 Tax=Alkalibacterium subtropicum TaxID=753702 RepID=A0A1I1HKG0_9LACT|nr:1-(5-phosphoribosyl)-5-((5-phosphoribosylamino)methylideneamino)imidazole-4-carboxamide isomerase [Alkalibacterium subtropicum]SFC21933.1 1-(5-phosphoribosyl)-5-[(5-phosphoribosylamino)methylideneamino] imidazole-4-carboxamide isomerase [Alkalibacterium subtropicum]
MIEIWPAIDLIDQQSVRLTEGVYDSKEIMERSPKEAISFYNRFKQVTRIHIVDLMGALHKKPSEKTFIKELIASSTYPVEIGGGIRSKETIDYYLSSGASYVIVGTRGMQDSQWLKEMTTLYPGKIYLGLDAKKDQVAVNGWTESVDKTIYDVAEETASLALGGIIYTDISKDGKMQGPNFELTEKLVELTPHPVTASGGIRSSDDLKRLEQAGIKAAIVGKAANTEAFWEGIS